MLRMCVGCQGRFGQLAREFFGTTSLVIFPGLFSGLFSCLFLFASPLGSATVLVEASGWA